MSSRYLVAVAGALLIAAGAQAQDSRPALAGGDQVGGIRTPVYRTDVTDLSRGRVADGFTFAAGGDLLGPFNPLTQLGDPDVNKMLKLLQDADVGFANHEASSFDLPGPPGTTQAAQNGGGYPRFSTALDRDFRAMGIKLVSMANNHAGDWGMEGLIATLATVQASGLVQAGAGASMNDARRAGVVYTPRGSVGLISTASTFNPATMAADGDGAIKPRPGVSVLRVRPVVALNEEQMVLMRRLSAAWWRPNYGVRDEPGSVTVGGATFKPGTDRGFTYLVDKEDHDAVISSISAAKRSNDLVAFSIHAHEVATSGSTASAAEFLPPLFHEAIDAGADIVLRSGPHVLGGVEIYKGKPIFYGLNSLFFIVGGAEAGTNAARRQQTGFYDSAVSVTEFKGGKPSVVRIYPITTIVDRPAAFGGSKIATGADAKRVLERIQKESEPFGTEIKIENDVGVIRIAR
jgi:poly-gamma-glutamate capsule biosynthesis protein CapA/YwtB (metallophosphatase superfamily)